ncbi:MAG: hypothetical protein ACKOYN_02215 [Planctomycetota bacterium]
MTTTRPASAPPQDAATTASAPRAAEGSLLERNLAALGERNLDIIQAIRAAEPARLDWSKAPDGSRVASLAGRALASRHAPREEAATFADAIDLRDKAVVVVLGFGLGYHIAPFCERLARTGLVVVLEPDVALLRAVLSEIDLSAELGAANVLLFQGDEAPGRYAEKFAGA